MVMRPVTVNDILDGHVVLDLECLDRIYLMLNVVLDDDLCAAGGRWG
jgi:hypothetical protein